MKISDLEHGAIYKLESGKLARCNIFYQGTEVWFTSKLGLEIGGALQRVECKVKDKDDSFKNNDILDYHIGERLMEHLLEIHRNAEGSKLAYMGVDGYDCSYRIAGPKAWGGST